MPWVGPALGAYELLGVLKYNEKPISNNLGAW